MAHELNLPLPSKVGEPPPTEFRVFKKGENTTIDGLTFVYDEEAAKSVLAVWKGHDTPLHIDFEHASEERASEGDIATQGAPAQGWFDLEDREDGLYAVNVRWLEPAKQYITEGKYRLFSPVFEALEGGRIVHLKSLGLTNIPRLNGLTPLVEAKEKDKTMDKSEEILNALKELTEAFKASTKAKEEEPKKPEADEKKAKDDEEAEKKEEAAKAVETCKGMLDAAIGKAITPAEAKEFKAKLDKREVVPAYVIGYLATAKVEQSGVAIAPPARAGSLFGFDDAVLVKCKSPSTTEWKRDHKAITSATEAEEHLVRVCKASNLDPEKVAKDWTENLKRYETYKEMGILK